MFSFDDVIGGFFGGCEFCYWVDEYGECFFNVFEGGVEFFVYFDVFLMVEICEESSDLRCWVEVVVWKVDCKEIVMFGDFILVCKCYWIYLIFVLEFGGLCKSGL